MTDENSMINCTTAPKRPQKKGGVQSVMEKMFGDKSAENIEEIVLDDEDDEWANSMMKPNCNKSKKKRENQVRDTDDFIANPAKRTEKWSVTSDNVKYSKIEAEEEVNRRRKRPRSFAVVELAPRECQCEVLDTLYTRFAKSFRVPVPEQEPTTVASAVTENAIHLRSLIDKMNRFEQLSNDLMCLMEDGQNFQQVFVIHCKDGDMKCQRNFIKHRTTMVGKTNANEITIDHSKQIVKKWLTYVFTAQIEWEENEADELCQIAGEYGPTGLVSSIRGRQSRVDDGFKRNGVIEIVADGETRKNDEAINVQDFLDVHNESNTCNSRDVEMDEFTNDDPLSGFGQSHNEFKTPTSLRRSDRRSQKIEIPNELDSFDMFQADNAVEEDSFDVPIPQHVSSLKTPPKLDSEKLKSGSHIRILKTNDVTQMPDYDRMGEDSFDMAIPQPASSLKTPPKLDSEKLKFGSHIRILKTNDVTPMPDYDRMDEEQLKICMDAIGHRPKGRKRMIEILKKAYNTLHPTVDPSTPTLRPLLQDEPTEKSKRPRKIPLPERFHRNLDDGDDSDGDKTLNISNDGFEELDDDDDDGDEQSTGEKLSNREIRNDINRLRQALIDWFRLPANSELHNHILSLQPVSLEELLTRLSKSTGDVRLIGKAKLATILDSLSITFQLPQKGGARRRH